MKLETQKFLHEHGLDELVSRFVIKAKRHEKHPNLVLFKYNQTDSPMHEPLVRECRGLILDEDRGWEIVAFPYTRFFNLGEANAAEIDWDTARFQEKLDGSLMILYFYDGQWEIASSGLPDASGSRHGGAGNFRELFWETWNGLGYALPEENHFCYMFELITPENKIIVQYDESRIVLHGCRDLRTLNEHPPEPVAEQYGWEAVRTFAFTDVDELLETTRAIDPKQGEGFVIRDANFNRLKVKNPRYVQLNALRDGVSPRAFTAMIRANETEEFLAYFPEYESDLEKLRTKLDALIGEIEETFAGLRDIDEQREFAAKAVPHGFSRALFELRSGKVQSAREAVNAMPAKVLHRLLGI